MSTRRSAGCRGRAGRLKRTVCSALPRLSALLSCNVGPTGTAFRESESGRSVRCERAGGRATTRAADGASLGRCGARIPLAWPAAQRGPIGRLHRLAQLATGRWRGRGPQPRTKPAVREAALPTAAPHQLWLRMGQAGARPVAVLATVARWPNGSRFGPYGQKEGFLTRIWSLATCAHESAEGHV